jgi:hypothetical protein
MTTPRHTSEQFVAFLGEVVGRLTVRSGNALRLSASGRLPTDAILRPPAAYRRIAAGQAKKVTGPAD